MDIHLHRRVRASLLLFILAGTGSDGAAGALLLAFDFDDPAGALELVPEFVDPAVTAAAWSDDLGLLTGFAGNPGRSLATSGFTSGNAFHLSLALQPGVAVTLDGIRFDLRASASGPTDWQLTVDGAAIGGGGTTTSFTTVDLPFVLAPTSGGLVIDLDGSGATSASGTLRLDNVEVSGSVSAVSLPPGFFLVATPLIGLALNRLGERCRQSRGAAAWVEPGG